ncbi:YeeE/YedE family protein [Shewanella surugensis]|uniref:YeeE/YedE family protein n=1 Tax=Shewanella surugensis TaxID=212020 RepID=A0ABT0LA78_9GAMM|nr:YeeE/YedE thiosulfate transporter family protein [Shewanella surugensis]MCL1124623.1 YeeE/YedE family protein [Shewanella surugensis]
MEQLTLMNSVIGGLILAASALTLLFFTGRITGVSGILHGLWQTTFSIEYWRITFILGLIISPFFSAIIGFNLPDQIDMSWSAISAGGLLVGLGTRVGSGCTSGHGICGIGRLSLRSIVATSMFITTAMITVLLLKFVS